MLTPRRDIKLIKKSRKQMLSEEVIEPAVVSVNDLFSDNTEQFLKPFESVVNPDIHEGMALDFELEGRLHTHKISPILRLAKPEDAEEITEIYKELYNGTYPYKEMEDVEEMRKMILDSGSQWIIYQDAQFNIAGCITFVLDFGNKRGYIRGFMLKKKYQGYIDITKAMIGSMISMVHKFRDIIYTWYVENRTAHAKSQYSMYVCGIAPIAFYPNKDIFLGKVESDLMQIFYDKRALTEFRTKKVPQFIQPVEKCFNYADARYRLGEYSIQNITNSNDFSNGSRLKKLEGCLTRTVSRDKFGYETIRFTFPDSDSFFEFLYTPQVKNFEKTKYCVENVEELIIFVKEFIKCGTELRIRYYEAFVSAYNPSHQKAFYDAGLCPRGYVPSWNYDNISGSFEDHILFNWCEGKIAKDIKLIDEAKELLEFVSGCDKILLLKKKGSQIIPAFYSIKSKVSSIWNFPKIIKSSLAIGMFFYLGFLFGSVIVANLFGPVGYSIFSHTISQLGTYMLTPHPSLFNLSCVIGGLTTVLFNCYLHRRIHLSSPQKNRNMLLFYKLTRYSSIVGGFGSIGILFVGIFSLERKGPLGILHGLVSIIAFGGFAISMLSLSITTFKYKTKIPRIFAVNGFIPIIFFILYSIFPLPFLEWLILLSIIASLFPLFCWLVFR